MSAKAEVINQVRSIYQNLRLGHKYTDPASVALALTGNPASENYQKVIRGIRRSPSERYLYDGAYDTLYSLRKEGDDIVIWTQGSVQGQLWKLACSGLLKIRDSFPNERDRFSVFAAEDKISPLSKLLDNALFQNQDRVVIVDDKSENIARAAEVVKQRKLAGIDQNIDLIWINQGVRKDKVPEGYCLESFSNAFTTINDIRQLIEIRKEIASKQPSARIQWLIDFGDTLVNTHALQEATYSHLAEIIESTPPIITHEIDLKLGLVGKVAEVTDLTVENHGKRIIELLLYDGRKIIIKYGDPQKIAKEIERYALLANTPLADRLVQPIETSLEPAYIVLPFIEGVQLREGVRTERISFDIAFHVLEQLLDLKKEFWSKQKKQDSSTKAVVSAQRDKWDFNLDRINQACQILAKKYNLTTDDIFNSSILYQGHTYPSLGQAINFVSQFFQEKSPYVVLTHGDAMGGNIVVNPGTGTWSLLDPEYAGYNDPAEAFAKAIKYITVATAERTNGLYATKEGGNLKLDLSIEFSPQAAALQQYGLSRLGEFATALNDPAFTQRVKKYLIGSYLREIALTIRRSNIDMAFFSLVRAVELLSEIGTNNSLNVK